MDNAQAIEAADAMDCEAACLDIQLQRGVMGILDDLRQQADQVRQDKEREEARQAELERTYQTGIRPAMLTIHQYLVDLVEQLAAVTWSVNLDFDFPGIGRVEKLEQRDYNISIDSQRNPKAIILRFDCVAPEEKRYTVATKPATDEACQFLLVQKVRFTDWALRDANREIIGYVIQAKLRVRTTLAIDADLENGGICVTSYNFDSVVEKGFQTSHTNVNEEWLDQLGHYILRKNTGFGRLNMSEEERRRIRLLVEAERRRYDSWAIDPSEDLVSEDGLLPKLRKLFVKPTR